jgi:DNA-binding LacI/PurR family transcriptional regulator
LTICDQILDNSSKDGRSAMLRYKEIKNLLTAEITKMNSNEQLPSRPELCKKFDTARLTLDKAINELVAEGALYSRKGGGTYVAGGNEGLSVHAGTNWGVIVPDVTDLFHAKIVRGVENVAQSYGINIILGNSDYDFDKQEQYIKRLNYAGVSGLIIVPVACGAIRENYLLYNQLSELKVPFVFCSRDAYGFNVPMVSSNNFYGGYIATKHLLEKGYRHIAYISQQKYHASIDRCQGYIAALLENGIAVNRKIIVMEDKSHTQPAGYKIMKEILASDQVVDAVFCFYDKITPGVYQAISEAGLAVSDDIGVIGYDDTDICEKLNPAVTTVAFKSLEVGTKAAEILYKMINNKEDLSDFDFYLFQPELVVRDSCLGLKKA